MESWLAEIKLRARRKIGELCKGLEKSKGGSRVTTEIKHSGTATPVMSPSC